MLPRQPLPPATAVLSVKSSTWAWPDAHAVPTAFPAWPSALSPLPPILSISHFSPSIAAFFATHTSPRYNGTGLCQLGFTTLVYTTLPSSKKDSGEPILVAVTYSAALTTLHNFKENKRHPKLTQKATLSHSAELDFSISSPAGNPAPAFWGGSSRHSIFRLPVIKDLPAEPQPAPASAFFWLPGWLA